MTAFYADYVAQVGETQTIPVSECFFPNEYGRPRQNAFINRVAADFKWALFQRPIVSERETGKYWVIDGNHRIQAVRIAFGTDVSIPVIVLSGHSISDEALIFAELNGLRRALLAVDIFKARITGKDSADVNLYRALASRHIRVLGMDVQSVGPGVVAAVGTLRRLDKREPHRLRVTLDVLKAAWHDEENGYQSHSLQAVNHFLTLHDANAGYSRDRLIMAMKKNDPQKLKVRINSLQTTLGGINPLRRFGAQVLGTWYNTRLAKARHVDVSGLR